MKKCILLIVTLIVAAIAVPSCKSTLPLRFDAFVSSVEKHYESYSEEDWDKVEDKFEKLFDEYEQNRSSYSTDEKKKINDALVRYASVLAKSGIGDVMDAFDEIASQVPGLIEDAKSFFEDLGEDLGFSGYDED